MLSALYDGLEAQVVADCRSTKEMGHLMHHVPIVDLAPAYFHKQTQYCETRSEWCINLL